MAEDEKLETILTCPVCLDSYKSGVKILQCKTGHGICEGCYERLKNNNTKNCPICKEVMTGTRNFMMEAMIKRLRRLSTGTLLSLDEDPAKKGNEEDLVNGNQAEREESIDTDENESMSPPRIETALVEAPEEVPPVSESTASTSNKRKPTQEQLERIERKRLKQQLNIGPPVQPKGTFPCIFGCPQRLGFCRLLNHARSLHRDNLTTVKCHISLTKVEATTEFKISIPTPCFRHIVFVPDFGLFVLCFKADAAKTAGLHQIISFVQIIGTCEMARVFNYSLDVKMGKYQVNCKDMVHSLAVNEEKLPAKEQCLLFTASKLASFAEVKMTITRNTGSKLRQPVEQEVKLITPESPDEGTSQAKKKKKKPKKKN